MTIRAQHILVEQAYEAADLERKLSEGVPFEELARRFSKCSSSKNGGDLGRFSQEKMIPEFSEVAFGLKVGEISQPVRTRFGYHLIRRTE